MKGFKVVCGLVLVAALFGAFGSFAAYAAEPLKIGVPLPLTGNLSETGQRILQGIEFSTKEWNAKGGVLGRPIELVVEDTASEVNTASEVAQKLIASDEVFALVGGYGSTVDYGMMQSIQSYEPLFIHAGSSTVKLEQDFGERDWYFHLFIWDYHRLQAFAKAISTQAPGAKRVAMLYEDGNYGLTSFEYAQKALPQFGLELVLAESYATGSADFSAILNKVKAAEPDVLFLVGYANDNISIARQAKNLQIPYDLFCFVGLGNLREDFGEAGDKLAYIDTWSRFINVEGLSAWSEKYQAEYGLPPVVTNIQGYACMEILMKAIEIAGDADKAKVITALEQNEFATPYGTWNWVKTELAKHNYLTENNMVMVQYQGDKEVVVYPESLATGDLIYPVN